MPSGSRGFNKWEFHSIQCVCGGLNLSENYVECVCYPRGFDK